MLQGVQEGVGRGRKGRGNEENESLQLAEDVYTHDVRNSSSAFLWISHSRGLTPASS